jgi:hypothetical protein
MRPSPTHSEWNSPLDSARSASAYSSSIVVAPNNTPRFGRLRPTLFIQLLLVRDPNGVYSLLPERLSDAKDVTLPLESELVDHVVWFTD